VKSKFPDFDDAAQCNYDLEATKKQSPLMKNFIDSFKKVVYIDNNINDDSFSLSEKKTL